MERYQDGRPHFTKKSIIYFLFTLFIDVNKEVLELDVNSGFSSYEIAKKYNKSQTTIRYWLKKFCLKTHPSSKYVDIDWSQAQVLIDDGMTWEDLRLNGFTTKSLQWAVKNNKIKMRAKSEAQKLAWKNGKITASIYQTPEHRKIMSRFGGIRARAGRCSHIKYTKTDGTVVDLQGSWEVKLAEFLDHNKIDWERNRVGYKYVFDGKERNYFPDFFLPSFDVYVEVKGYETEKDGAKWKQFPFKLLIIKKEEIHDLTSWKTSVLMAI